MRPLSPKFDLEYQYQLYLQRVKLDEATMHIEQKIQVRQAFYGAVGQLLILQRDDIGALSEREAIGVFESLIAQVDQFWKKDIARHNAKQGLN